MMLGRNFRSSLRLRNFNFGHANNCFQNEIFVPPVCMSKLCYTSSISATASNRNDPTAKRPNRVCDPYGQSGEPMSKEDSTTQLSLLESGWIILSNSNDEPLSIQREFCHINYVDGSRFITKVAAVAHNNNHYPSIKLERRLMKKEKAWRVVSIITCDTEVLGGLSFHDFHIAMLIDVEVNRSDAKQLIVDENESLSKHT